MPSWKKVIISGSAAELSSLYAPSITGSLQGTSSFAVTASYALTSSFSLATSANQILAINKSGFTITKGTVVHLTGSNNSSDTPYITTASYESDNLSANTLGIASETITFNATGYVTTEGVLTGLNVTGYQAGQVVYLGATGSIIGSAPQAPLHSVRLGQVVRDSPSNNGSIYVRVDNGYEIGELHDVVDTTTTESYGDLLVKSGSVWINSNQLTGSYALTGSLIITGSTSGNLVRITQTGTGNAFVVEDADNPDTSPFVVNASGNVGIGTTTPAAKFEIKSAAQNNLGGLLLRAASSANYPALIYETTNQSGVLELYSGSTLTTQLYANGNSFFNGGNVGIGTTTPSAKLHVIGNTLITGSLGVTGSLFVTGSTSNDLVRITQAGSGNAFTVYDINSDTTPFVINSSGSVGIGTPTPSSYTSRLIVLADSSGTSGIRSTGFGNHAIIGNGATNYAGVYGESVGDDAGEYFGGYFKSYQADTPINTNTYIGAKFEAISDATNYSVQLKDGTQAVGKVLVSQDASGSANWSTRLSGSYEVTGSLTTTGLVNFKGLSSTTTPNVIYIDTASGALSYASIGAGSSVNIGNSDLTITSNATRVLSHSGTSRFIISGSTSSNMLELTNITTGNTRVLRMQQQLNGESDRHAVRNFTAAGNNGDDAQHNRWMSDHIAEFESGSAVAINKLRGWKWSYYTEDPSSIYKDILLISTSNEATLNASLTVTGSTFLTGTVEGSYGNIIVIDTGSGQLYYTASSAIGGTGLSGLSNYISYFDTNTSLSYTDLHYDGKYTIGYGLGWDNENYGKFGIYNTSTNPAFIAEGYQQGGVFLTRGVNTGMNYALSATAEGSTNVGNTAIYAVASGVSSSNIGGQFTATGGTITPGYSGYSNLGLYVFSDSSANIGTAVTNSGIHITVTGRPGDAKYIGQFSDGSEGVGKVLTCISSSGLATWQTPSGGSSFPYTGSAQITGSLGITGSLSIGQSLNATATSTANIGSTTIYSVSTSSYDGAWFEYTARSGSNARAGQIMSIWSGSVVNFTETTTTDFGSTAGLSLGVFIVNGAMALTASAATNGWNIKTIVRSI